MNKYLFFVISTLSLQALSQQHGMHVDVNSFMDSTNEMLINIGNRIVIGAVVLASVGLMIPGFREVTKRNLPWIILGILGIILVTRFWR